MKALFLLRTLLLGQLLVSAQAQEPAPQTSAPRDSTGHFFAIVVDNKVLTTEGDWQQSLRLRGYAMTRSGTYVVFTSGSGLSLLTDASQISKLISLYREVDRLDKEQKRLEAKQSPLNKQQKELAVQMKKAGSPEEMRRIGTEQDKVGSEQAAVGRDQGRFGEEQGIAGHKFYNAVQAALDACVKNLSCFRV